YAFGTVRAVGTVGFHADHSRKRTGTRAGDRRERGYGQHLSWSGSNRPTIHRDTATVQSDRPAFGSRSAAHRAPAGGSLHPHHGHIRLRRRGAVLWLWLRHGLHAV